jgi:glucokinase
MSNALHWGELDGEVLAHSLKLDKFVFLNDFEAIAYGVCAL